MRRNEAVKTVVTVNANGIDKEVYNFTELLVVKGLNKADGFKFSGLNKDHFTLTDRTFADYKTEVDELHNALYNHKSGVSHLEKVAQFLGIEIDAKKIAKGLTSRKVNVNRLNKSSEHYAVIKAMQTDLEKLVANTDLDPSEKEKQVKIAKAELEAYKTMNACYESTAVYQLSAPVFRTYIELELASFLAQTNIYADFRTEKERILSNKTWTRYQAKADFYGIDFEAYATDLNIKGLKAKVKACYKALGGDDIVNRVALTKGVDSAKFNNVNDYIEALYKADNELFTACYNKSVDELKANLLELATKEDSNK